MIFTNSIRSMGQVIAACTLIGIGGVFIVLAAYPDTLNYVAAK